MARNFVARTGATFTMLWSSSFDSWRHFGVTSQPRLVLLDRSGVQAGATMNRFDAALVEERLNELS